jgi:3-oxoacyl-[acyl-carrier protein] reductase
LTTHLIGKTALVTDGSRGIGAAIVRRLSEDGANVAFTYAASTDKADALVGELTAKCRNAIAIAADSACARTMTWTLDSATRRDRTRSLKLDCARRFEA